MNSYVFDIGEKARTVSRFIGHVRSELQQAFLFEKSARKLTQQKVADAIGTTRHVINRELVGEENITLRRLAELAWALGWEIVFELRKPQLSAVVVIPALAFPLVANVTSNSGAAATSAPINFYNIIPALAA
jgi:hypothetical protein